MVRLYNTLMSNTKTVCAALSVSPVSIWNKAGKSIIGAGRWAPQEALRIVRSKTLTDNELALLVTAGVDLLSREKQGE